MEFHIELIVPAPDFDLDAIGQAIGMVDPSVLVDVDPTGRMLRVATSIDRVQLAALIGQAGYPVTADQVTQLPSICCGGCSG